MCLLTLVNDPSGREAQVERSRFVYLHTVAPAADLDIYPDKKSFCFPKPFWDELGRPCLDIE